MQTIKCITRYLGPDLSRKIPQPAELQIPHDGSLCETFRKVLLEQREAFSTVIAFPPHPTLACNFAHLGQTAGIAQWFRNDVTLGLTLFMAGLDDDEDMLVADCLSLKPYPVTLYEWQQISEYPRPVFVNLLFTPEAAVDRVLATAAPDLAYTLFAILGIASEE